MNKLKIAFKCMEVAVNLIVLVTTGKEIVDAIKKRRNKSEIKSTVSV